MASLEKLVTIVPSDPIEKELKKQTDILGDLLRIEKNALQEIRNTNIILLDLVRRLAPDDGETDEEKEL